MMSCAKSRAMLSRTEGQHTYERTGAAQVCDLVALRSRAGVSCHHSPLPGRTRTDGPW